MTARFPVSQVTMTDLLERPLTEAPRVGGVTWREGGTVALSLRPFELVTLRLRR
ncbi:glycosyl hydrolase-related protein [Nonomuraea sp. 3-1Str]|nr:glycosyl hydrolase-related protein [Nonomuraea sp. 3-1Str]